MVVCAAGFMGFLKNMRLASAMAREGLRAAWAISYIQ